MDRNIYFLSCFFGLAVALAVLHWLGATRRGRISVFAWLFCIAGGIVLLFYGLLRSTAPSFAPRVTADGRASAFTEQRYGRDSKFVFRFTPRSGSPVTLETHIIVPHWANAGVFNGRTLKVTYLNDASRSVSNEAVAIEILSGENTGWHGSRDARPFGLWLAIPIAAAIVGFGCIGLRYRKSDLKAVGAF